MLTPAESKILSKIHESQLITKTELKEFMKSNGSQRDVTNLINSATGSLMEKGLVSEVRPLGSTCYIVTQKGTRFLSD